MDLSHFALGALTFAVAIFAGMVLFMELGRRIAISQSAKLGEASRTSASVVAGVVNAVVALLLGFMFSGATTRFDQRRELVVQEVSTISTAWQRIDALPPASQPAVRDLLRRYVDEVQAKYANSNGTEEFKRQMGIVTLAQDSLWKNAAAVCVTPEGEKARMLLLPALNEMFDAVDRERLQRWIHPPLVIYVMLVVAVLAAGLFSGYNLGGSAPRNWLYMIGIAATISVVTYVITELEYPRLGLVRADTLDFALEEVRASMQ